MIEHIVKTLRMGEWWASRLATFIAFALLAVALSEQATEARFALFGRLLLSTICLASYAHVLNDWSDIAVDTQAGKPNRMAQAALWQRWTLVGFLLIIGFGAWIGAKLSPALWLLLLLIALLQPIYALPPLRFKTRGWMGIVTDALHTLALPLLFIWLVFGQQGTNTIGWLFPLTTVVWAFTWGVRSILIHQLIDNSADKHSNVQTLVVQVGNTRGQQIAGRIFYIELLLLAGLIGASWVYLPIFAGLVTGYLLLLSGLILLRRTKPQLTIAPNVRFQPILLADLYTGWFSVFAAVTLLVAAWGTPLAWLCLIVPFLWVWHGVRWFRRVVLGWFYWWVWLRLHKVVRVILGREQRALQPLLDQPWHTTFVLPDANNVGGVTTWSLAMAQALHGRGCNTRIMSHRNNANSLSHSPQTDLPLIEYHGRRPSIATLQDVARYQASYTKLLPGVIIPNYSIGAYGACAQLARNYADHLRVIGFAHTDEPYYYDLLVHYEPLIHRFVAVSQEIGAILRARLPQRSADVLVRPYGVAVPHTLHRHMRSLDEPLQIVYAGRLVEKQKRVSRLVELVRLLDNRQVNYVLNIVGTGQAETVLRAQLGKHRRVCFQGYVSPDKMAGVWHSADICLLVSDYEGTSIAMLEAMAQGCVPVVPQVSGMEAVIFSAENGFTVPVGDMAATAAILAWLDKQPKELFQAGKNAHTTICEQNSLHNYIDWFEALTESVQLLPPRPWPAIRGILPPRRG